MGKNAQHHVIRELQIKMRYHHVLIKRLNSKTITPNAGKDMEQQGLYCWWKCKIVLWKTVWQFLAKLSMQFLAFTQMH